jgi:hypothetical protein
MSKKQRYRTINISAPLHIALKVHCANQGLTMAGVVEESLWRDVLGRLSGGVGSVDASARGDGSAKRGPGDGRAPAESVGAVPMPLMPRAGEERGLDESDEIF